MKEKKQLSRYEFLKLMSVISSAVILNACKLQKEISDEIEKPTETYVKPNPTIEPTKTQVFNIVPEMVLVEAGELEMGSVDGYDDEQPIHKVMISQSFYIGKYEVTFDEFDVYCVLTQKYSKPDDNGKGRGKRPVTGVNWNDAVAYCNWMSEAEGLTPCYSGKGKVTKCDFSANGYRLPTEAEWEYAARGGVESQGFIYAGSNDPDEVAWYGDNEGKGAREVGQKAPNEIGLFDMSGNRFEWCWDWYVKDYYHQSPPVDPRGPSMPKVESPFDLVRVRRGGSWGESSKSVRIATRSFDAPSYPGGNGFRLARNA